MKPRKPRGKTAFDPIDVHVGKRLRIRRKNCGLSQTKLGDSIGLTFQQIQKYEKGANRIGASRLFEFSNILDVPVSYFFDDMSPEFAGQSSTESLGRDIFDTPEAADLVRAFTRITDNRVRHGFKELAKAFAKDDA